MFGYVTIDKSEMLVKDYDTYNAIYCSLCKQLGREYTFLSRFILSYDCTFYALVALALADDCPGFCRGKCTFNPLKKCNYIKSGDTALSMASAISICTAYYKLLDNISDGNFFQRLLCKLLLPLFSLWRKKAARKFPDIDNILADMTKAQNSVESDLECCIDKAAEPTAIMLSKACAMLSDLNHSDSGAQQRVLSTFGYFLGKWIYLMDAAADLEDDKKSGNFNPFIIAYDITDDHTDDINSALNHCLSELLLSYDLLDIKRFDRIICNIIKLGLPKKQNSVLFNNN